MIKDINDFLESKELAKLARPLTKSTMAVKHHSETKWNKDNNPLPCIVMEKKDGINCILLNVNHDYKCFTREGKRMKNMELLERYYSNKKFCDLLNTMVNCEVCNDHFSLEELGAVIKSSRKKALSIDEDLKHLGTYLVAFDKVTLDEFIKGTSNEPFHKRILSLVKLSAIGLRLPRTEYCYSEDIVDHFFTNITDNGGEGIVRVLPTSPWVAGYKNHFKTKKVRGVDYDLEVIGIEEGKGKRQGMVANLMLRWCAYGDVSNPVECICVDGRFTDDLRVNWFTYPEEIIGQVVHVHALQVGSKGGLRLAKVHEIRMDKTNPDL